GDEDHPGDSLDAMLYSSVKHIKVPSSWKKVKEFSFNQGMRVSGALWQHGNIYSLYIKGAPEHVLNRCGQHHRKDAKVTEMMEAFTGRGYRTIAFAHKNFSSPVEKLDHNVLSDMEFDGFVGMADEIRENV